MRLAIFAAVLVLAASGCRTASGRRDAGALAGRTVEGRVEEVGRDDGTLTLRTGDARRAFLVAPEAEIRIDDFKGTFADLKEGQRVRASLEQVEGRAEGTRIEILDQGAVAPDVGTPPEAGPRPPGEGR